MNNSIASLVTLGRETREVEYKRSVPWDKIKNRIAKTALGMANLRGGGTIVVGMEEGKGGSFTPTGISKDAASTFNEDDITAYINRFADPYVRIELHRFTSDETDFLAIVVHEFDDIPIVCKRDAASELRQGAIYARSRRMPETTEVRSQTEMREIITAASEKGARRLLQTIEDVGGIRQARPSDEDDFESQLQDLKGEGDEASKILTQIESQGHWHVVIRPSSFDQKRIATLTECSDAIEAASVYARNRHIPHVDIHERHLGSDWVSFRADHGVSPLSEYWRLYQSGQLVGYVPFYEDSINKDTMDQLQFFTPANQCDPPPSGFVSVENCLWMVTEIYEVAARLALRASFDGDVEIRISMKGVEGRMLFFWKECFIRGHYQAHVPELQECENTSFSDLLADPGSLALHTASSFLEHFGWMPPPVDMLRAMQHDFMQKYGLGSR